MFYLVRPIVSELIRIAIPVSGALVFLIPAFLAFSFWWEGQNNGLRLSLVPEGLNVSRIVGYANVGEVPLPSENSNGLVVYELPTSTAERLSGGGTTELIKVLGGDGNARFQVWRETPFNEASSPHLSVDDREKKMGDYLAGWWRETASPELEQDAVGLLRQPGNFYSFDRDRRRMLIVAPISRRVVYAFSE